jgi:hypothetical protein
MPYALCLAVLLCAGCASRELTGGSIRLSPEQIVWLEQRIEADFADVPVIAGSTVAEGKIIVRANGEVISSRSIMQAAKRGLARSGASETERGDATLLIQGEINVNAFQEDRCSATRYTCEMKLIAVKSDSVLYAQFYTIINRHGNDSRGPRRACGGAAAEQRWADIMGVAHPPTVSERQRRNRAATKAVGAGPQGRGGEAPELSIGMNNGAGSSVP